MGGDGGDRVRVDCAQAIVTVIFKDKPAFHNILVLS